MPANINPIYSLTPNVGRAKILQNYACVKSDGTSSGAGIEIMTKVFTAGANGSYVDRIRFTPVASAAAVNTIATTLRVFISTVAAPGATTPIDTSLLAEISVPIVSASHSTNAANNYEIPIGLAVPSGSYLHVTQHLAQAANQQWQCMIFGGDY